MVVKWSTFIAFSSRCDTARRSVVCVSMLMANVPRAASTILSTNSTTMSRGIAEAWGLASMKSSRSCCISRARENTVPLRRTVRVLARMNLVTSDWAKSRREIWASFTPGSFFMPPMTSSSHGKKG